MLVDFPVELLFQIFAALPTDALYALARCSRLLNAVAISLLLPRFSIEPTAKSYSFHLLYDELDTLSILALAFSAPLAVETLTIAFPELKVKLDPNLPLAAQDLSFDPTSVYPDAGHIRCVADVMHRLRSCRNGKPKNPDHG
uniref:F-box domain-containing protein n=1 Tax=Mycena chlorophos TaxID=658473 RepID=A0ABQ0LQT5_MYCCL|nr:predicted protein [Mycena chlorophos]